MRKLILLLMLSVFLIGIASASLGTFKVNTCVEIKTILNSSIVNISTLSYPNSSVALTDANMTKRGQTFYHIFCNTTEIGTYLYDYYDEIGNVYVNDFDITYTGTEFTTAQSIIYIVFLIASICLFVLTLIGAIKFPWKNNKGEEGEIISVNHFKYVKILFIALSYVFFMFIAGLLRGITAFYIPEIGVDKLFNFVYWMLLSFLWPLIIIFFVIAVVNYLTDKKLMKALVRGVPTR